jgi:hypothetical protein
MPFGTFLDGREPERLRGLMFLSLSDTGNVVRGSFTSDAGGGGTIAWTAGSALPCRIDPLTQTGGREQLVAGRVSDRATHVVTVPPGTVADTDDRFVVSGRGTFEIVAVRERTKEWARMVEVVET